MLELDFAAWNELMPIDWDGLSRPHGKSGSRLIARVALPKILGDEEIAIAVNKYVEDRGDLQCGWLPQP